MVDISSAVALDVDFATMLGATKSDFVTSSERGVSIAQHGAAVIRADDWPGWPELPATIGAREPVIETYVASGDGVMATSDNEPFVSSWLSLIEWLNQAVRGALHTHGVELDGDAYATASLTATETLEGMAHMDDDTFVPDDSVSVVAIVGEHVGPRVATGQLSLETLRPMSQIVWQDQQLRDFEADLINHCVCEPDQLVIFPQFGQLHAGPSAAATSNFAAHRQLLVYRGRVTC